MKKTLLLCVASLLTACADTHRFIYDEEGGDDTETIDALTLDNLTDLWATYVNTTATWADASETVPTDMTDPTWGDFMENQDFEDRTIGIRFDGDTAYVDGEQKNDTITVAGAHVTIRSARGHVNYILSGASPDGSVKVYSTKKLCLTLAGLTLTHPDGPAINIQTKKRCFIWCADASANVIADLYADADSTDVYTTQYDAATGEVEDAKGVIFSEGQLILGGAGSLTVNAGIGHAIASDQYVRTHSGLSLDATALHADGIHAKDSVVIGGGDIRLRGSSQGCQADTITGIHISGGRVLAAGHKAFKCGDTAFNITGGTVCGIGLKSSHAHLNGEAIVNDELMVNGNRVKAFCVDADR